ncbi:MAG: FAD-dependent oxidoreductase [Betaproteobacteria bacterium]|nr:FAD-dependent oxidoreductase [Betaproteobacteria bacterium]
MSGHVVVIGAGVVGLCSALYCVQRGWRVTVVERQPEQRDGCSFGNTGLIVPSHFVPLAAPGVVSQGLKWMRDPGSPFYVQPRASWDLIDWGFKFWRAAKAEHVRRAAPVLRDLSLASRECYQALADTDNDFQLARTGVLVLCKTLQALDDEAEVANHAAALGLRVEVLDAAATAALDPGVRMDVAGAVHFAQDCNLVPERLIAGLQRRLAAHGVRFAWNTEAVGWQLDGERIAAVKLGAEAEIGADAFVLAAGSWSSELARSLGLKLPLQAGKGYSLTLAHPRQSPRMCAILAEARVAVSPMGGALRFGGTMEMCGLDESVNPIRVRSIVAAVPRYYPDFTPADFDGIRPWRGLRPCSPDGLPYVGRTSRCANLAIATGHAMLGVTLGPITGQLVAQVLSGEQPELDLTLLSPDRYH